MACAAYPLNKASRQDILQLEGVRDYERRCTDLEQADKCLTAFFDHVHPLMPILHREAFYSLYHLYGYKVISDRAKYIVDASTREGRATSLICSVLALGALTLKADKPNKQNSENAGCYSFHFGLGLGFRRTSLRLLAYTHDHIETMIAYLFMVSLKYTAFRTNAFQGIFAVHITDLKGLDSSPLFQQLIYRSLSSSSTLPNTGYCTEFIYLC